MPISLESAAQNFENVAASDGANKQEMAAAAAEFQAADDAAGDPAAFNGVATAIKNAEVSLGTGGGAAVQGFGGQAVSNDGDGSYSQAGTMQAVGAALAQAQNGGVMAQLQQELSGLTAELRQLMSGMSAGTTPASSFGAGSSAMPSGASGEATGLAAGTQAGPMQALQQAAQNFMAVAGSDGASKQEMAAAAAQFQAANAAAGSPAAFSGVATAIQNAEVSLGTGGGAAVQGFGGQAVSNDGDGSYSQAGTMQAVGTALAQANGSLASGNAMGQIAGELAQVASQLERMVQQAV